MRLFLPLLFLLISNSFMTLAWYGHLRFSAFQALSRWGLFGVILLSWGLAFFEYCFQVPANKLGFIGNGGPFTLTQLKVAQEVITLVVFVVFSRLFFPEEVLRWNHYLAFALLVGAVYLAFLKV